MRGQVRLEYEIRGQAATLIELRVPWQPASPDDPWTRSAVARFRYTADTNRWSLHWCDRNERWHPYEHRLAADLADLLAEVVADPTGIFWG